jgi:hypothetical protein
MLQILVSSERLRLGFRKCAAAAAAFDGTFADKRVICSYCTRQFLSSSLRKKERNTACANLS